MLVIITITLMTVLTFFSIILGESFISAIVEYEISNEAFIDGASNTFEVLNAQFLVAIDTSTLVGALLIITGTLIAIALITGITFLGSGLNPESSRIVVLGTTYVGIWTLLSVLAFPLILEIEIFGSIIYIAITIGYTIGVIQRISPGGSE